MAVLRHEARKPAVVIAMAVTQDQAVEPRRLDIEQAEIAVDDVGRVAEIEQILRRGAALLGFEMQR